MIGVVLVRQGDNPELRYAMRSWAKNARELSTVIALGMPPRWVNMATIYTPQSSTKYANTTAALATACRSKDVPEQFVLLNDDFFALRPTRVPTWHRGPMLEVVSSYRARGINSVYVQGMEATAKALIRDGVELPLCYEVHAPMVVQRDLLADVLDTYTRDKSIRVLHKRSAYSNLAVQAGVQHQGVQVEDVKLRVQGRELDASTADGPVWNGTLPRLDWVSTSDTVWADGAAQLLMDRFPVQSRWESTVVSSRTPTSPGRIRHTA